MATHPPYCVVLSYSDDDEKMMTVHHVDKRKLAPLLRNGTSMPIYLDEYSDNLDDEFVRRLGVAMLNVLALGQPELKQFVTAKQEPSPQSTSVRPETFVASYDHSAQTIVSGFVQSSVVSGAHLSLQNIRKVSEAHPMDDELARRLGVQALHMFAALNPDVKDLLRVTNAEGETLTIWDKPPKP
ncbi:hypothetical protein [Burkholderia cenocepacia]|uniref:hypothetical protein n=1 Tax=Burkholderia cenocepacia TaxID=95486 RepID=UPI001B9CCC8E|nr:hypothetical protein [Burkholderia cenocepacia]MBR8405552.1 hypothetical protein [Burkholderia cenocepacia]